MKVLEDLRALGDAPRELWIIYAVKLLESVAYFTVYSLLAIALSEDLGLGDEAAGAVTGTWLTAISVLVFGAGFVADAMGLRRALAISVLSTVLGRGAMALLPGELGLYAGLALCMWGIASLKPTMNAAVRAWSTEANVSMAFSLYYVVMNLGAVLQGPIIDQFRRIFAEGTTLFGVTFTSSRLIFLVGFGCSLINLGLVSLIREPQRAVPSQRSVLSIAREVVAEKVFWRFFAFVVLLTMVRLIFQHAHLTWPKYSLREFGEDFPFATYWSINPAMIIVLTPFVTALTRRLPTYPVIVVGAMISAASVFAMALSTSVEASVVFIVTLSIGEALWSPRLYEYTATVAPPGREASYMGLSEIPMFLAKPVVGWLSGWFLATWCPAEGPRDSQMMWAVVGMMTVASPALMIVFRRYLQGSDGARA